MSQANGAERKEITDRLKRLVSADRSIRWEQGDLVNALLETMSPMEAYREVGRILGKSEYWAFYLGKVSRAFPPDTDRNLADWHLYRVAASHKDPQAALGLALKEGREPEKLAAWIRSQKFSKDK